MTIDPDVECYVINLDRSLDRLHSAAMQLNAVGIRWCRISAVDANDVRDAISTYCDVQSFTRNAGRPISPSEVALALSHFKAMQTFLESSAKFAVIFEDDLRIDDIGEFKNLIELLTTKFEGWDIVRLSGGHRHPIPVSEVRLCGPYSLAAPLLKTTGTVCYMINRRAAETIPGAIAPFDDYYDHLLDHPWRFGLKYRVVFPFPVHEARFRTTLDYSPRKAKFSPWQRRFALYYRIRVGLARLAYNARQAFFANMLLKNLLSGKGPS